MTIYDVLLELIWLRSHAHSVNRVMLALNEAVAECGAGIDKASKVKSDKYIDAVIDEECGVIENLAGAALVTCQAEITSVVAHTSQIHLAAKAQGHTLSACDGRKHGIRALGSHQIAGTPYTHIQVIDAFANYFKHRDEWTGEWAALPRLQKQTAEIIQAVGAREFSTGNLRKGLEALGVEYDQLHLLAETVQKWASEVHRAYENELKQKGLL
jgi:hypothetical protein